MTAARDLSQPEVPDRAYADALQARTERLARALAHVSSPFTGAPAGLAAPVIKVSPPEVALHTAEFAQWARSAAGDEAATDAAYGLALTALDFLADASLREAVRADFEAAGGVLNVEGYFR
jgi:hypothetical protein